MQIGFELCLSMILFHKYTMKELCIDKTIKNSYNEESEQYKNICEMHKNEIGFDREKDKDSFDEKLMKILGTEAREIEKNTIKDIEEAIKKCYCGDAKGYITFGGHILNPIDFCAVRIDGFTIKITKK